MNKESYYLSTLQLGEFKKILHQFDIQLDEVMEENILSVLQNNQYALQNDTYQFVLESYIKKLTGDFTSQKMHKLFNYFKPLLNV